MVQKVWSHVNIYFWGMFGRGGWDLIGENWNKGFVGCRLLYEDEFEAFQLHKMLLSL